jgi:hypothetical protein
MAAATDARPYVYTYQVRSKRWAFTAMNGLEFEKNNVVLERWDNDRYVVCRRLFSRQQAEGQIKLGADLEKVSMYVVLDTKGEKDPAFGEVVLELVRPVNAEKKDAERLDIYLNDKCKSSISLRSAWIPYEDVRMILQETLADDAAAATTVPPEERKELQRGEPIKQFDMLSEMYMAMV